MVFYEVVFYSATNVNSVKPRGRSSQPKRHRCYQIMQNPTGFDLGTIIRPNCLLRGGRGRKGASLIEFYVAVVGDLSMPKFITRRIIMPYKNWQSQIGPHTSSHSHHFTLSLFLFWWKWNICVWHWREKNQYEFRNHSVRFIIFWQIYLLVSLIWEIRYITYFYSVGSCIEGDLSVKLLGLIAFSYLNLKRS